MNSSQKKKLVDGTCPCVVLQAQVSLCVPTCINQSSHPLMSTNEIKTLFLFNSERLVSLHVATELPLKLNFFMSKVYEQTSSKMKRILINKKNNSMKRIEA